MRVAVGQPRIYPDRDEQVREIEHQIGKAKLEGAELLVLPEMSIIPFFPRQPHRYEFFRTAEYRDGATFELFRALARRHHIGIMYNFYERSDMGLFFDTSVVVNNEGELMGCQRMMHLAEEPYYNEKFYYTPGWDDYRVFKLGQWKFGIAICYDRHFPEVFRSFVLQGCQLVLVPTAVSKSETFAEVYELEMRAAAVTHGVYIAMANRAGREGEVDFIGHSMIITPMGKVAADAGPEPGAIAVAKLKMSDVLNARILFPFLRDRRPETYWRVSMTRLDQLDADGVFEATEKDE